MWMAGVVYYPTAQWTSQQLLEAFPFESAPRYLLHDRDAIYGEKVKPVQQLDHRRKSAHNIPLILLGQFNYLSGT